jgi:predicted secreted Zn-dependent protease
VNFETLVLKNLQAGMGRIDAVKAAARQRPDLHEKYLLENNSRRAAPAIEDRFDEYHEQVATKAAVHKIRRHR